LPQADIFPCCSCDPVANTSVTDQEIFDAANRLPPIATVLRRLLAVLQDPNSDIEDISKLIRVDAALTAQVLRVANSPMYGRPERVETVEEAIQQIGLNEVSQLASSLSARQVTSRELKYYRVSQPQLWTHILAVAIGAEVMAARFLADPAIAYIAGLLHTVGLGTLDLVAVERRIPLRPPNLSLLDWEQRNFGDNNSEIGARILKSWSFPADIVDAVASRYTEPTAKTLFAAGSGMYLASCIAEKIPAGLPFEKGIFLSPYQLEEIGFSKDELADLKLEIAQKLSRMQAMMNL